MLLKVPQKLEVDSTFRQILHVKMPRFVLPRRQSLHKILAILLTPQACCVTIVARAFNNLWCGNADAESAVDDHPADIIFGLQPCVGGSRTQQCRSVAKRRPAWALFKRQNEYE